MDNVWSPQPRKTEVFRFGLFRFRSPLLTESRLISLPEATEMFQFTSSLHVKLWIHFTLNTRLTYPGSPIRKSADLSVCATPRSLSQLVTSFIDDRCQGIRPALLVTWPILSIQHLCWFKAMVLLLTSNYPKHIFEWEDSSISYRLAICLCQ